jgi:hypothetical protein
MISVCVIFEHFNDGNGIYWKVDIGFKDAYMQFRLVFVVSR